MRERERKSPPTPPWNSRLHPRPSRPSSSSTSSLRSLLSRAQARPPPSITSGLRSSLPRSPLLDLQSRLLPPRSPPISDPQSLDQEKRKVKDVELKGHTDSVDQLCWDPKHNDLVVTAAGDKTFRL